MPHAQDHLDHQARAQPALDDATRAFYRDAMERLNAAQVPYLVGGAYAFHLYTGIERHTKDFDVFVRPEDRERALEALAKAGYQTELTFPHWLGKAFNGDAFVDVIFCSGNGVARVDDEWFAHGHDGEVLGMPARLIPAEEMLWSKMFVMERERYDGADVAHLIRAYGDRIDWRRLLRRFDAHWRVLHSHLILYGFIYPAERARVPDWVLIELMGRLRSDLASREAGDPEQPSEKVCEGTLISREQYLTDTREWGYTDGRIAEGHMTPEQVQQWTEAIGTIA